MTTQDQNAGLSLATQMGLFRNSLPLQVKLQEILRALGPTEGQRCLEVGAPNVMIGYHLRRLGGSWQTLVTSEAALPTAREVGGDGVRVFGGGPLPFDEKSFDAMVVMDLLERLEADEPFIEECHRVLKSDGRLVLTVRRFKRWTLIRPIDRFLGRSVRMSGRVRDGYSESDIFRLLKRGFDVHSVRSCIRFFLALTDTLVGFAGRRLGLAAPGREAAARRFYAVASVLYRLALQLDTLIFFVRGHTDVIVARRRRWGARDAPVLSDGRSISEAVLSRPARR